MPLSKWPPVGHIGFLNGILRRQGYSQNGAVLELSQLTQAGQLFCFVNAHDINLSNLYADVDYVLSLFN